MLLRLACLLICLWLPAFAQSADRVALVIGNAQYAELPDVIYAQSDAKAISSALREVGYSVTQLLNADLPDLRRALKALEQQAGEAEVVIVFYTGHAGVERGRIFLLPTDVPEELRDFEFEGIDLESVVGGLMTMQTETRFVMLDLYDPLSITSRDNGTVASNLPEAISNLDIPSGVALLSNTAPGDVASMADQAASAGNYAPLVREFLVGSGRDDISIDVLGRSISHYLNKQGEAAHQTRYHSALDRDVALGTPRQRDVTATAPMATAAPAADDQELAFFTTAMQSGDPAFLMAFLEEFPDGDFAALVRRRLIQIQSSAGVAVASPASRPATRPRAPARRAPASKAKPRAKPAPAANSGGAGFGSSDARGWVFTGKKETPSFPWPPPQPSGTVLLPLEAIGTAAAGQAVGDVMTYLETALNQQGYHDRSYWSVPGGVALATRLERIDRDGQPILTPTRWPTAKLEADFSLGAYLKSLFYTQPGFFRVIVFALTTEAIAPTERKTTSDEALDWLRRGMVTLPKEIAEKDIEATHNLTALIYEFEKIEDSEAIVLAPGRLTGREHLQSAGLLAALLSN